MNNKDYKHKYGKYKKKYQDAKKESIGQQNKHDVIEIDDKIIKIMFPYKEGLDWTKLKVNEEATYSSSQIHGAKMIVDIMKSYFKDRDDLVVTDGTSNIGTDAITLALDPKIKKVNAIELIDKNCELLKHNVGIYDLQDKVDIFCADFLEQINKLDAKLSQDIIYVDPPWGGVDYSKHDNMNLFLGDKEIAQVVLDHLDKTKIFVIKVPNNFDFNNFMKKVRPDQVDIYSFKREGSERVVFYVIVVKSSGWSLFLS